MTHGRFEPLNQKSLSKDIKNNISRRIIDVINNDKISAPFNAKTEGRQHLSKIHFWVTLLDQSVGVEHMTRDTKSNGFQNMCNPDNSLISMHPGVIYSFRDPSNNLTNSRRYNEGELVFCTSTFARQMQLWKAAKINEKVKYWNALQENFVTIENMANESSSEFQSSISIESEVRLPNFGNRSGSRHNKSNLGSDRNNSMLSEQRLLDPAPTQSKKPEPIEEDPNVDEDSESIFDPEQSNLNVSSIQIKLWKEYTPVNEKYNLWFENFSIYDKI